MKMKIKNLPKDIQERVFECQKELGNEPNAEIELTKIQINGGFDWVKTKEGFIVWNAVSLGNYRPFYEFHGKKEMDLIESIGRVGHYPSINKTLDTQPIADLMDKSIEKLKATLKPETVEKSPEFLRAKEFYDYNVGDTKNKESVAVISTLEKIFPELKQKDWRDITTIEQVYNITLRVDMNGRGLSMEGYKSISSFATCRSICMAINKDAKELDWSDNSQNKYCIAYEHEHEKLVVTRRRYCQDLPKEFYFAETEKGEHIIEHFGKYFEAFTKGGVNE